MKKHVLFIQGAGEGAYQEDALLAASLQDSLGPAYEVHYPQMPEQDSDTYADWEARLATELAALNGEVILVGHSVGGSVLLKYLSDGKVDQPVAGLFVIAPPYWSDDDFWNWDDARLPQDAAAKLSGVPRIFFYHSRDDKVVPFAHFELYAAKFPQATIRVFDGRGHQFRNDMTDVARDIIRAETP
jgi:predicted alpha/beta hydrolase family esterase